MAFELIDAGNGVLQYFGNVFLKDLITPREVVVDGDLITNYVCCPKLTVRNGSLLSPYIDVPILHADILGVFDLTKPFEAPERWTFTWLRPAKLPLPTENDWASEFSIQSIVASFLDPDLVVNTAMIYKLLDKVRAKPTCARSRVLFSVVIEELMDNSSALTPLGRQMCALLLSQPRLPREWRY